jgi:hypothetical protein
MIDRVAVGSKCISLSAMKRLAGAWPVTVSASTGPSAARAAAPQTTEHQTRRAQRASEVVMANALFGRRFGVTAAALRSTAAAEFQPRPEIVSRDRLRQVRES